MQPSRDAGSAQDSVDRRKRANDANGFPLDTSAKPISLLASEWHGKTGSASDSSCATASPMSIASPANGSKAASSRSNAISSGSSSGGPKISEKRSEIAPGTGSSVKTQLCTNSASNEASSRMTSPL